MNDTAPGSTAGTAKIIYILYLVNVVVPFTGLVGVIMAYLNQKDADEMLKTHYRFQIRTFWIGLLYVFIGALLSVVLIGYLILLFYVVWLIVRCVKGMQALDKNEAHPNPASWMFG
ncbi:MAG: DUF4870 domain-containing protein [Gammaproteobacteria bacterium]|nr:DUF4870 domain-containing protein [Gammaproteobacteria bacterium]